MCKIKHGKHLQACSMETMHNFHMVSEAPGQPWNLGNCQYMMLFNLYKSACGNAGYSCVLVGVQFFISSFPNMAPLLAFFSTEFQLNFQFWASHFLPGLFAHHVECVLESLKKARQHLLVHEELQDRVVTLLCRLHSRSQPCLIQWRQTECSEDGSAVTEGSVAYLVTSTD